MLEDMIIWINLLGLFFGVFFGGNKLNIKCFENKLK